MEQIHHPAAKKVYCRDWKGLELLIPLAFMTAGGKETPPLGESWSRTVLGNQPRADKGISIDILMHRDGENSTPTFIWTNNQRKAKQNSKDSLLAGGKGLGSEWLWGTAEQHIWLDSCPKGTMQ